MFSFLAELHVSGLTRMKYIAPKTMQGINTRPFLLTIFIFSLLLHCFPNISCQAELENIFLFIPFYSVTGQFFVKSYHSRIHWMAHT